MRTALLAVAVVVLGLVAAALATARAYRTGPLPIRALLIVLLASARTARRTARLALDYRHGYTTGRWRRRWRAATYQPERRGTLADQPQPLPGKVDRATATPAGARLDVLLPSGVHPGNLDGQVVASAMHARRATVAHSDRGPRHAIVRVTRADLLTNTIPPAQLTMRPDLEAVPVGLDEDGHPWHLRIRGSHVLLGGVTGSGKGSVIWNVLRYLSPAIAEGSVEAWGVDPKGGMELGMGRDVFAAYEDADPYAMVALLETAGRAMHARARDLSGRVRTHVPRPGDPHVVVVVDEVANLTAYHPDAKLRNRAKAALGLLTTQGRAPGLTVIAALQDPRVEVLSIRNLFPVRVALRCDEAQQVDMVLGQGARLRGALADQISDARPGTGYVARDGSREVLRVRAAYVDDAEVGRVAAAVALARTHAGGRATSDGEAGGAPARDRARAREELPAVLHLLETSTVAARRRRASRRAANRAEHRARQEQRDQARRGAP